MHRPWTWATLASMGLGLVGVACTLTSDDFNPTIAIGQNSASDDGGVSGSVGSGGAAEILCEYPLGCCASDTDCDAGETCSAVGACELTSCVNAEDVSACEVGLCPGPNCPNPTEEANCSDDVRNGDEAGVDCGQVCPNRCAPDSACSDNLDCTSFNCVANQCAEASCVDGVPNQDETDTDCGGSCEARCQGGDSCLVDSDCGADFFCPASTRVCTNNSCQDELQNGTEILTDCGGGECPGCPVGTDCQNATDCDSGVCGDDDVCSEPGCDDEVQNQNESGVDCGGDCNAGCAPGSVCVETSDCDSEVCEAAGCGPGIETCCQAPSCDDDVQNGNEPQVDCGSVASCGLCPVGSSCANNGQCQTNRCGGGECQPIPPCEDNRLSGNESDVDCGGNDPACDRCPDGDTCRVDGDCDNDDCVGGTCVSCDDNAENATETDVDCGGNNPDCARCPNGDNCNVGGDCVSTECNNGVCVNFSCDDDVRNGTETGIDCGGTDPACLRCPDGTGCTQSSDCSNQNCLNGTCISCGDSATNGSETDIDCGGTDPFCNRCPAGRVCRIDSDCAASNTGIAACVGGRCCGGTQRDCTRCAERLSPTLDCSTPGGGIDPTGINFCGQFLGCLSSNAVCTTRDAPACSGEGDVCSQNGFFGGVAGTGVSRANQVLQNAGCQL